MRKTTRIEALQRTKKVNIFQNSICSFLKTFQLFVFNMWRLKTKVKTNNMSNIIMFLSKPLTVGCSLKQKKQFWLLNAYSKRRMGKMCKASFESLIYKKETKFLDDY